MITGAEYIRGWKEIAARLDRDERTVKRWEKRRGLPVRRIPGGGRANVYLLEADLVAWLARDNTGHADPRLTALAVPISPSSPASLPGTFTPPASRDRLGRAFPTPVGGSPRSKSPIQRVLLRAPRHLGALLGGLSVVLLALGVAVYASGRRVHAGPTALAAARLQPPYRPRPEIEQLYLQGLYQSEVRTPDSLRAARETFNAVIAADPHFAPGYSGLAATFLLLREYSTMPPADAYERAQAAAEHAVALDPALAGAHSALGFIVFFSLWRPEDAAREFETAIRLDPRNSTAHHWYGSMLMHQGRFAEAVAQLDQAQHLDPTSTAILSTRALALGYGGRRDEGVALLGSLIRANPSASGPHRNLAYLCLQPPEDVPRFLREMQQFALMQGDAAMGSALAAGARAYPRGGDRGMWLAILAEQRAAPPGSDRPTLLMAQAESALGHRVAALDDLDVLAARRDSALMALAVSAPFAPLHGDPRFHRLAARLGVRVDPSRGVLAPRTAAVAAVPSPP